MVMAIIWYLEAFSQQSDELKTNVKQTLLLKQNKKLMYLKSAYCPQTALHMHPLYMHWCGILDNILAASLTNRMHPAHRENGFVEICLLYYLRFNPFFVCLFCPSLAGNLNVAWVDTTEMHTNTKTNNTIESMSFKTSWKQSPPTSAYITQAQYSNPHNSSLPHSFIHLPTYPMS